MMEEYNFDKMASEEEGCCPRCGQPLNLDLNMAMINGELYVWFEGICTDCLSSVLDPMPVLTAMPEENRRILWRILSN